MRKIKFKDFRKVFAVTVFLFSAVIHGFAQPGNSCANGLAIVPDTVFNNQQISGTEMWYEFTATAADMQITVHAQSTTSNISGLELYAGNCTGTALSAGLAYNEGYILNYYAFSVGTLYKLKISSSGQSADDFNIYITDIKSPCSCINAPSSCQLICNGSFEDFNAMPIFQGQIEFACPWTHNVSADFHYMNPISLDVNAPGNRFGRQWPRTGKGYAGIFTYDGTDADYREYIVQQFTQPLQSGQVYIVSFWASLADTVGKVTKEIGAFISVGAPPGLNSQAALGLTPQIKTTTFIDNKSGWFQVTAAYTAQGGETHITIGNFNNDANTQLQTSSVLYQSGNPLNLDSYYYIEDVSVTAQAGMTMASNTSFCLGNPAVVQVNVTNGNPVSYSWQPSNEVFPNNNFSGFVYPQTTQTYTVTVAFDNGCVLTDSSTITQRPPATANAGTDITHCQGQPLVLTGTGTGGVYSWKTISGQQLCTGCTSVTVTPTVTTSYVFTAQNSVSGCIQRDTVTVTILPAPTANAGNDITVCLGQNALLNGTVSGTFAQSNWLTNLTNSLCVNCTSVNFTPQIGIQYAVFSATNTLTGCTDTDTALITVTQLPGVALVPVNGNSSNILCSSVEYMITGAPQGTTFNWTHSYTGSISGGVTGVGTYTVNWQDSAITSGSVTCLVVGEDNCSALLTLPVITTCCEALPNEDNIPLNNATASDLYTEIGSFCPLCIVTPGTITAPAGGIAMHINGVFTVDQPLILVNFTEIRMGTNARIDIVPGNTLELKNCTTSTFCGMMWDGIYIPGFAGLKTNTGTLLQQARNAVVSTNGGQYGIENTTFRNCVKGIVAQSLSSGSHLGTVHSSVFEMPGTFLPALPSLPVATTKTLAGIEINNVSNITIGDASQATFKNTFTGLFKGVYAYASGTTIRNADFTNIVASNQVTMSGTAVHCEGQKAVPYIQFVNVGGTAANQPCTFDNIRRGIAVSLAHNVNVTGNSFTNFTVWFNNPASGIAVTNCLGRNINITNNRISNFNATNRLQNGIIVTDVSGSTVTISNNRLLQSSNTANSYAEQVGTGITVQNTSAAPVSLTVLNNDTISRFAYGITLTNISNTAQALVKSNRILFAKPKANYNTQLHYGIGLINCTQIKADSNRVQRITSGIWQSSDAATLATNLRGVYVTNSSGCIISQNTFTGLGEGVHANSTCPATFFVCNQFNQSYRACMFTGANANNAAYLNDQLNFQSTIYPTGNVFAGSATSDLAGSIRLVSNTLNPIFWYYSGILPTTGALVSNSIQNNVPTSTNNSSPCNLTPFLMAQGSDQRDMLAGAQVSVSEDEQAGEMTQEMAAKDAHLLLLQNPDWLNMNTPLDADYQQFYAETDTSEIGKTNHTEMAAQNEDTLQAVQLNTTLNGSTALTETHKMVFEIFNRTWLLGNTELSGADSAALLPVALQHPADGGEAVYTARVMLGITVDDATGNYSYRLAEPGTTPFIAAEVFPNPAATQVTVIGKFKETDEMNFALYDLTGRVVANQQLTSGNGSITVDLTNVQPGAYLYQITVNGTLMQSERLVIAR